MMNRKHYEMKQEAIVDILNHLKDFDGYYSELHHEVFNTDWYIIGTYQAKEVLKEYDVFEAIELVMEYENFHFGEVTTELYDPEKLLNMIYYIIGDEVIAETLQEVPEFFDNWNETATDELNAIIINAMKEKYDID